MNTHPPEIFKTLAHELRWSLVKMLTESDYRVQELVETTHEPMNLVSYHLKKLRDDGMVTTRRSEADGRDVYYTLDLVQLQALFFQAGASLHPSLQPHTVANALYPKKRVLFLCTHNSARSQMAEALLRHLSDGQVDAFSAGSHPTRIHPDAVDTMQAFNIDIQTQTSKHMQDYVDMTFDYVITVCDLARENCPVFNHAGQSLHWGYSDPSTIQDATERQKTFMNIAKSLKQRVHYFLQTLYIHPEAS